MIQLGDHFSSDDRSRHSEWLRRRQWFIKAKQEHHRKEEIAEKLDDEILSFAAETIMATEIQIEEFKARLNDYDQATVAALMENQELQAEIKRRLFDVQSRIQDMLNRAYVMEDGRRVFLTEDRTQAFDEHGTEITRDELDFNLVPKHNPTWESLSEAFSEQDRLVNDFKKAEIEREQILEFQEKVDDVREKVADGKMTKDGIDDFGAELADATPASVKKHLINAPTVENAPDAKATFAAHANPASIVPTTTPEQAPVFDPMG